MRFTKPAWVQHSDDSRSEGVATKRLSIFSVDVHPDGSRIATGGLDTKVRIWSTKPILNEASELSGKPPKSLCTLEMHAGPVLTVRWARNGRWLASGSDDQHVNIWDLNPHGGGSKRWGSNEINVEGWKLLRSLAGHNSDVTDLAWAPDDRYLASTGLDSVILIWNGNTLELVRRLTRHQGFVKGVCWDPVCEYLATQSDDRCVCIWRTSDWGLEASISKPFEHSPSTFFRRLSWSPDGAHITASNATSNNGMVFTAAVITRNTWTSDISLVGHENSVEVASYNPHIFLRDPSQPIATSNICSVVALGADDNSVSIWQTKSARPLIVAKEVFERSIMDLGWSADGLTLYAVSSDGTLAVFAFESQELEGIASPESHRQYLTKYGLAVPASVATTMPERPKPIQQVQGSLDNTANRSEGEKITMLNVRRGPRNRDTNRRRVEVTSLNSGASNNRNNFTSSNPMGSASMSMSAPPNIIEQSDSTSFVSSFQPPADSRFMRGMDRMDYESTMDFTSHDLSVPISALHDRDGKWGSNGVSVDVGIGDIDERQIAKLRMQGWDYKRDRSAPTAIEPRMSSGALGLQNIAGPSRHSDGLSGVALPTASYSSVLRIGVEGSNEVLEAHNGSDLEGPYDIALFRNKDEIFTWIDYLHSPSLAICASSRFCAAALADGSIIVFSPSGRRIMPTLNLGHQVSFLDAADYHLMAITTAGVLHVWNIKTLSATHSPVSILPLLQPTPPTPSQPNGTPARSVLSATVRINGAPLIHLSNRTAHSYDSSLLSWVTVGESFWLGGSSAWKTRARSSSNAVPGGLGNGVVHQIEENILEQTPDGDRLQSPTERPPWQTTAHTLDHLGTRMQAARVLGSPQEYKQALLLYAKLLADEGFRSRAEELFKDLFGPVYWRPGKGDISWCSTVAGLNKRDLAKDVSSIFARSKTLAKLGQDYQDLLRKSNSADD